jgi:hypothetical protein
MPFASEKQRAYLYANKPEVAKEFAQDSKDQRQTSNPPSADDKIAAMKRLVQSQGK